MTVHMLHLLHAFNSTRISPYFPQLATLPSCILPNLHLSHILPRSYCIGLFLAPAVQSLTENHQNYQLYLIGTRMRNVLMAAIYRKCLRLSNSAMQVQCLSAPSHLSSLIHCHDTLSLLALADCQSVLGSNGAPLCTCPSPCLLSALPRSLP